MRRCFLFSWICVFAACAAPSAEEESYSDIQIVSAMRNVMWRGELGAKIYLDTLSDKRGLYGVGPVEGLRGELLINDGVAYISRVAPDSSILMEESYEVGAPFFVYANVNEWAEQPLPDSIATIAQLETYLDENTRTAKRPFVFKLSGTVVRANYHVQNLAPGTRVSSPQEAHSGQVKYVLENEPVELIGFFSTDHQTVFTHHDTYLHLHLITQDKTRMGHLDAVELGAMRLFLPVR